ncbi:HD-GYP domain-containing protein [Deinococcus hohokamensis]|uniref:HD-GYP domain-containing protein n=1 Tax=Deinococcus hohokamensis TaxID=309883 RepID=A0ABV9IBZ2_9DEIO
MTPAAQRNALAPASPTQWGTADVTWAGRAPQPGPVPPALPGAWPLLASLAHLDPELRAHTLRVASLSHKLGVRLGLRAEQLTHLAWAAQLHDIGKLDLPQGLQHKAGELLPAERTAVRAHAVLGEARVRVSLNVSSEVLSAIRHHHEHWNGLGYPDGLRGTEIPLLARILTVCDVYDALLSPRSYKPAWTPQEARTELRRCAGQQFDPGLVPVLLSVLDEGEPAGRRLPDTEAAC